MKRNWQMLRAMSHGVLTPNAPHILCIRNRDDACCAQSVWEVPALYKAAFVSVPGEHDDLWMRPKQYAAIIKAYYGANVLAQTTAE